MGYYYLKMFVQLMAHLCSVYLYFIIEWGYGYLGDAVHLLFPLLLNLVLQPQIFLKCDFSQISSGGREGRVRLSNFTLFPGIKRGGQNGATQRKSNLVLQKNVIKSLTRRFLISYEKKHRETSLRIRIISII